ncbi:MAG: hypothetical protein EXR86_11520 [Gammaproteobacteria bacterium]|nr:hypothetical protein [Gammaproteobacteria bacterium]
MSPETLQDQPPVPGIMRVVREFLESIIDQVPDADRYHAMCCVYLMNVAERELAVDPVAPELKQRIDAFLGEIRPLPDAIQEFSVGLREGRCDARWDETFALVLAQVVAKVQVSKPDHLQPIHRK